MGLINACSDPQPPNLGDRKEETMKKTYINPQLEVIKIQTTQMLAGSPGEAHEEVPEEYGGRGDNGYDW